MPDPMPVARPTRGYQSLEQEAYLALQRAAAALGHAMGEVMKPHGLTTTQYNVLRILRGAGEPGLCRNEVRDRMIARVPDVTRLLDRLEEMGLIERSREGDDRRYVITRITPDGLDLLDRLDRPVEEAHRALLGHLPAERLRALVDLLDACAP